MFNDTIIDASQQSGQPPAAPGEKLGLEGVLCYIEDGTAYFTTQDLTKQWGDDWNDAPYEHNAGEPYGFSDHDAKRGEKPWQITTIHFGGWISSKEPKDDFQYNSPFSVEQINNGAVPWLTLNRSTREGGDIKIMAGTPIQEFCEIIYDAGGSIWLPITKAQFLNYK